jgi:hypothetical protein
VPIFEIDQGRLKPFARVIPGPHLYESTIRDLAWSDLEAFFGEGLFPVRKEAPVSHGRVDILALDGRGRVVVIEFKRDVDRNQLAQCLEYAGWAASASLDVMAELYDSGTRAGAEAFFQDWQIFTDSETPQTIVPPARVLLVARAIHELTHAAIDYLAERSVPISVFPVTVYRDDSNRQIIAIDAEHEPSAAALSTGSSLEANVTSRTRVTVADLIAAELVSAGDRVVFERPRVGERYEAQITAEGEFDLGDGRTAGSPSGAARILLDGRAYDGWNAWRLPERDNVLLATLRTRYRQAIEEPVSEPG